MDLETLSTTARKIVEKNKDIADWLVDNEKKKLKSLNKDIYMLHRIKRGVGVKLSEVTERQLVVFVNKVREEVKKEEISASYFNSIISVARSYFFVHKHRKFPLPKDDRFEHLKVKKRKAVLDHKEVKALIAGVDGRSILWERIMVRFFLLGFRISDAIYFYTENINRKHLMLQIDKNSHYEPKYWDDEYARFVPIEKELLELIDRYIKNERPAPIFPKNNKLLFLDEADRNARYGHPMKVREVERVFKDWCEDSGVDTKYHPHILRATYISSQLEAGTRREDLVISTGHRNEGSLASYIREKDAKIRAKRVRSGYGGVEGNE